MNFPIVDAHQHIWDPSVAEYDWLSDRVSPINRAFSFDEALPELRQAGISYSILVQAADNFEDTRLMRDTAEVYPEVIGIVGYVPLDKPREALQELENWQSDKLMVGARSLIHDRSDPFWLLRDDVSDGLRALSQLGYTFDVAAEKPEHLVSVVKISETNPTLNMVIDHLAKPPIGLGNDAEWKAMIREVAQNPRVFGKISGLYSATADLSAWSTDQIRPYFDFALEIFGPERLMYGGDWPVVLLAGGYERFWAGLMPLFASLSKEEKEQILGRTAFNFYKIPTPLPA